MSAKELVRDYSRFRGAGYGAAQSLRAAKACAEFRKLESAGLVRVRYEEEQEDYFSVFGEPEGYTDLNGKRVSAKQEREEMCRTLERDGCWIVFTEYRASESDAWAIADSVGMCSGYKNPVSPTENCYVPDLMRAAVKAVEAQSLAPMI